MLCIRHVIAVSYHAIKAIFVYTSSFAPANIITIIFILTLIFQIKLPYTYVINFFSDVVDLSSTHFIISYGWDERIWRMLLVACNCQPSSIFQRATTDLNNWSDMCAVVVVRGKNPHKYKLAPNGITCISSWNQLWPGYAVMVYKLW